MARSRYKILDNESSHFLTCSIVNWICVFSKPDIAQIVLDSLKYLQQNNRLELYAYVIMENHLHLLASSENLSEEIGDFKSYTARAIIDHLKKENSMFYLEQFKEYKLQHRIDRTYQVWQEGSHPQAIFGMNMLRQKVVYIHQNPVRRGYVDDPEQWRYSSARNYAGMNGLIDVCTDW